MLNRGHPAALVKHFPRGVNDGVLRCRGKVKPGCHNENGNGGVNENGNGDKSDGLPLAREAVYPDLPLIRKPTDIRQSGALSALCGCLMAAGCC